MRLSRHVFCIQIWTLQSQPITVVWSDETSFRCWIQEVVRVRLREISRAILYGLARNCKDLAGIFEVLRFEPVVGRQLLDHRCDCVTIYLGVTRKKRIRQVLPDLLSGMTSRPF